MRASRRVEPHLVALDDQRASPLALPPRLLSSERVARAIASRVVGNTAFSTGSSRTARLVATRTSTARLSRTALCNSHWPKQSRSAARGSLRRTRSLCCPRRRLWFRKTRETSADASAEHRAANVGVRRTSRRYGQCCAAGGRVKGSRPRPARSACRWREANKRVGSRARSRALRRCCQPLRPWGGHLGCGAGVGA